MRNQPRPRRGRGLLFVLMLAVIVFAFVRGGDPSITSTVRLTVSPRATSVTVPAPVFAPATVPPTAVRPASAWGQTLSVSLDALVTQYTAQGIERVGVVIEDGHTGEIVGRNADDRFAAASLYKLFVLWRTQAEIRSGRLTDISQLRLTAANDDSDDDGYTLGSYGDTLSVAELRRVMITASGNTAAWVLAQYFGWGTIDQLIHAHGFRDTQIAGKATTTARDITRVFAGIVNRDLDPALRPEDYDLMVRLLQDQQINSKLSTGFPPNTLFAHKTGDLDDVHHDAGIVWLPNGQFAYVTVLTQGDYDASIGFQHDLAQVIAQSLQR